MYEQYGLGRVLDPETPRAVALHRVKAETTTRTYRHYPAKTRLNQEGSTCVGNAFAHRRANGPLQIKGIDEAFAVKLYLEATTFFYGAPDTSLQNGTSALSACQALVKRGAIDWYQWAASPEDMRYMVLERGSICVGCSWYSSMFDTYPDGLGHRYIRYNPATTRVGGHEFEVVGIDLAPADGSKPYYDILNSWGPDWGIDGKARIEIPHLEELAFTGWGDAVLIHELPRKVP
jgi:hypothetical protein